MMLMVAKVTCKPFNAALRGKLDKVVQRLGDSNLAGTLKFLGLNIDGTCRCAKKRFITYKIMRPVNY